MQLGCCWLTPNLQLIHIYRAYHREYRIPWEFRSNEYINAYWSKSSFLTWSIPYWFHPLHLDIQSAARRTKTLWLYGLVPEFISNFNTMTPPTLSDQWLQTRHMNDLVRLRSASQRGKRQSASRRIKTRESSQSLGSTTEAMTGIGHCFGNTMYCHLIAAQLWFLAVWGHLLYGFCYGPLEVLLRT